MATSAGGAPGWLDDTTGMKTTEWFAGGGGGEAEAEGDGWPPLGGGEPD
jgi:hypothetical protein